MTWLDLATVAKTTPTDPRIQRLNRSLMTSDRAAAGMQPKSSARGAVGMGPSRALSACVLATEV
jgi:hypothetical protein